MRDDLTATKSQVVPPTPKTSSTAPAPTAQSTKEPVSPAVPLRAPIPAQKKGGGKLIAFLVVILLLVAVGGAGAWYFLTQNLTITNQPTPTPVANTLDQVIPASRLLVAHYKFANETERQQMLTVWKARVIEPPSMRGLLAGNPTLLLEETTVQEFAYVLLANDPRLYLLVPANEEVNQLVAQRSNVQVKDIGGWKIMHSFSTDLLEQQLASSGPDILTASAQPLTLTIDQLYAGQLSEEAAQAVTSKDLILGISFDSTGAIASFSGNAFQAPAGLPSQDVASDLLAYIPPDASKVVIGSNFSQYHDRATNPAEQQLISELTGPFVYYEGVGADSLADYGLVIKVPPTLSTPLQMGDPVLEEATTTLLTMSGLTAPASALTFSDGAYLEVPLRYVNIDRLSQVAIDYALIDDALVITTSRESIFSIIEAARSQIEPFITSPAWKNLIPGASVAAQVSPTLFSTTNNPVLQSILPTSTASGLNFWATIEPATAGPALRGQVTL